MPKQPSLLTVVSNRHFFSNSVGLIIASCCVYQDVSVVSVQSVPDVPFTVGDSAFHTVFAANMGGDTEATFLGDFV